MQKCKFKKQAAAWLIRETELGTGHYLAGGWATIFGGRVIIFFKPSRGGSQFFSSLQGEGHIFFNG